MLLPIEVLPGGIIRSDNLLVSIRRMLRINLLTKPRLTLGGFLVCDLPGRNLDVKG